MLKEKIKNYVVAAMDVLLANLSVLITLFVLAIEQKNYDIHFKGFFVGVPIFAIVIIAIYYVFGNYRIIWKYARVLDGIKFALSTAFAYLLYMGLHVVITSELLKIVAWRFEIQVYLFSAAVGMLLLVMSRVVFRVTDNQKTDRADKNAKKRIMIIGGGSAGSMLLHDMMLNKAFDKYRVMCIIDDNPAKNGMVLYGVNIVGDRTTILENVKKFNIDQIIFAIPTCPPVEKAKILEICSRAGCKVSSVPSIDQMIDGKPTLSNVRQINVEDLLGREPINVDIESIIGYVYGKRILVTGGGGSIGSELCRQLTKHHPKQLIIFDIYENNAYNILNELKTDHPDLDVIALIGSVRDAVRLEEVFSEYRPEIVYHAAAHKHVPLMEDSPREAIKNNVIGTENTVRMADKYKVQRFLLISTDKAVNPTNIMGASKRICEMIVQTCSRHSDTVFMIVRFGNVLGSNGSVIPLFEKQIEDGGPVTVTDKRIIRYFMTIPEAVSLVLQAGALGRGGEIFVLDMGKPMKILELAENLIRLSGYVPYEDIKIEFIGLRPGEKLYEELLMAEEGLRDTANKMIHIGRPIDIDEEKLFDQLKVLKDAAYAEGSDIRGLVKEIVPTYNPT